MFVCRVTRSAYTISWIGQDVNGLDRKVPKSFWSRTQETLPAILSLNQSASRMNWPSPRDSRQANSQPDIFRLISRFSPKLTLLTSARKISLYQTLPNKAEFACDGEAGHDNPKLGSGRDSLCDRLGVARPLRPAGSPLGLGLLLLLGSWLLIRRWAGALEQPLDMASFVATAVLLGVWSGVCAGRGARAEGSAKPVLPGLITCLER